MSYYHQKKTISLTPHPTKPFTNSIKFTQLQKKITKQDPPLKGRINSLLKEGHFAPGQNGEAPIANACTNSLKVKTSNEFKDSPQIAPSLFPT